ncbi:MAG: 50S ribosomal protein L9 [Myxococcales bacterium]|nr:50S ribosomal protein L9 [Myxococcales bacterium]
MRHVKLILRESVPSLGEAGDLVDVKVGFARNYLLPKQKAILATEARVREIEHHKRVVMEKVVKEMKSLEAVRDRLQATRLEVAARVGEEGKLFGSVTAAQIAELLAEKGFDIERRKIALDEPIKEAGEHRVSIRLHRDVIAEVALTVLPEA